GSGASGHESTPEASAAQPAPAAAGYERTQFSENTGQRLPSAAFLVTATRTGANVLVWAARNGRALAHARVLARPVVGAGVGCGAALRWGAAQRYIDRHLVVVNRSQPGAAAAGAALVEEGRDVLAQLRDFLAHDRRLGFGNSRTDGPLLALAGAQQVTAASRPTYSLTPIAHAELQKVLACYRQSADEEDAGQPDQNGDEDRHDVQELAAAENLVAKLVVEQRQG